MILTKNLGFFLNAFLIFLMSSFNAFGADWAVVISDKAIIYADAQMSASIGYLSKGRKIRVGEKPKNNGRVLPLIIQKKVAYIKVVDIERSSKEAAVENVTTRINERTKQTMGNNKVAILLGSSVSNVYFPESATTDTEYSMLFLGGGIRVYREEGSSKTGLKGSLEFMTGKRDDEEISTFSIPFDYYYKVLQGNVLELHLSGGLNIIPFAEYKLGDDFTLNGYGYGAQVGSELVFKFSRIGVHIEGVYAYKKLMGFKLPENELYPEKLEPSLNSVSIKALVSYAY